MKRAGAALLVVLMLLLAAALAFKGQLTQPPPVAAAEAGQFDAMRAKARLARLLGDQRPHPVDTAADDAVRGRLVAELQAMGLQPRVTDDWACGGSKGGRSAVCARIRNVVATIGDAAAPHQLLLASHYDSTPVGPGASDDGIGVATMLEVASLLKGRKLARPVALLFDEGEEAGLLGAHAFLEHDPQAARIESLINFEARGVTGPATMFETSRPNGPAIGAFKASAARPVANSMTADFYRLIPNSTDVTVFAARPWTILNFAVIGNETRYHSPGDTVAALDPASLQHMGRQGLSAAVRLTEAGSGAIGGGGGGERIYADVAGRVLIVLPRTLGLALFGLLVAGVAVFAWGRRDGLLRGAGAMIAAVLGSAALVFVLQWLTGMARPGSFWRAHPDAMALAVDLAALAVSVGALAWVGRGLSRERLRAAFWLVFMVLSLGIVFVAPGAAIFSLIPPLIMLVGWLAGQRARRAETVAALLAWAALFLTWGPLVHLSEVLLDFWSAWLFAPFAALLVLPALIELKPLGAFRPAALALAGVAAVAAWGAMLALPAYSEDRKQGFRIEYAWDGTAAKGQWLVGNGGVPLPDGFPQRGAFKAAVKLPWTASSRWTAPAPAIPLPAPRIERVGERPGSGGRIVAVRVAANGADDVLVRFEGTARVRAFGTGGSNVAFGAEAGKEPYLLRCTGRSCDGAVFEVSLPAAPAEATVIGIRDSLPAAAAPLVRARPATAQAQYGPDASINWTKVPL
ncbi:MAG TPA: M28 family peptidase [Allosphingosinicella sp.]|jgi:hypothetical protein